MSSLLMIAIDLIAISILSFGLYHRRHRRRDLVTAFVVINVGVMAVAMLLASAEISMGVGLGIFGVLSIIRLRSSEISQHEVAYYFASLAIGLIAGFNALQPLISAGLIALILAVLAAVDSRLVLSRSRQQVIRVDRAIADETSLRSYVEQLLGGTVQAMEVIQLDMVNDTTMVDIRWQKSSGPADQQQVSSDDLRVSDDLLTQAGAPIERSPVTNAASPLQNVGGQR